MLSWLIKIMYVVIWFIFLSFVYGIMWNSINDWIETLINWINNNILIYFNSIENLMRLLLVFWLFFAFIKKNFLEKKE